MLVFESNRIFILKYDYIYIYIKITKSHMCLVEMAQLKSTL